ncbi:PAP2 family protein [Paenibacillus nanensis]|uniref:PAP2 family protein n=1 Tax=Paenibacillus nanensis TaxID=393251 RepID=A0A3A1UZ79_9BACL|nr:PAP2 family protein [Paenibacillus nanensis]
MPEEGGHAFDRWAHSLLSDWRNGTVTAWMKGFSYLGSTLTIIIVTIGSAVIFGFLKGWRFTVMLIGGVLFGYLLNRVLKGWIDRARPETLWGITADGASFPSANAMLGMIMFGLILVIIWRESKLPKAVNAVVCALLALCILLMGVCRVYFHVHYITDVLAGYSAGLAVICATIRIGDVRYRKTKGR